MGAVSIWHIAAFFVLVILIPLWITPGLVANHRKHPNALPIWFLTIFMGWTVVGWIAAFIWAFVTPSQRLDDKVN
ncbi:MULTISPECIES: superinfection immunity protein [Asticcacaulis]|uniref:superinfection immunity protein n=1 Tax=Asticcacaulis TaxID=76890 RepID=UPI001AE8C548|nr:MULTISPECIES: superinfection immunity protein [Asticcacaulis]MBP2159582.1 phage shock protein PspC (stress-responsive transcriptional regulator) [Asticcacaulis solisilvae]MDR6800591.1 hypothetical protein [Asticcacaulis sp. BE141]